MRGDELVGSRVSRLSLTFKPVISCDPEGVYYPIFKARSEEKALQKLVDQIKQDCVNSDHYRIGVAHGQNPTLVKKLAAKIEEATGHPVDFIGECHHRSAFILDRG